MKYDSIIIGGGLSGLTAGIRLVSAGKKVAIITSGQSALHFSSGSMSLLNRIDGRQVCDPLQAIATLPPSHPYQKIGVGNIHDFAAEATMILRRAGLDVEGYPEAHRYCLTPFGVWQPAWLTVKDIASCSHPSRCTWRKAAIVNFKGYLDFHPGYLADGLATAGIASESYEIELPQLAALRKSCSGMRAASMARILEGKAVSDLAQAIRKIKSDADVLLLPAVVGLRSDAPANLLASLVDITVRYVPVIPMSVTGVRAEFLMRRRFESLGGAYFLGDSVNKGNFENNRLISVNTVNLGETPLRADEFLIATGSFFSQGLVAKPDAVIEPVFGLDVVQSEKRTSRCDIDFFAPQPYMRFGVVTDSRFRVSRNGSVVTNLRAVGSILSGADSLNEGSGAGIALLTAVAAARQILQ